jgi:hypothetical protein
VSRNIVKHLNPIREMEVTLRKLTNAVYAVGRSKVWFIRYTYRGRVHRESSGSHDRPSALRLMKRRLERGPPTERQSTNYRYVPSVRASLPPLTGELPSGIRYHTVRAVGSEQAMQDLVRRQQGACAVCDRVFGRQRRAVLDHDHVTGHRRGLVCHRCNLWIGLMENASMVERILRYLRQHGSTVSVSA